MSESKEILTLRLMAWQRAKGELGAMMQTYWEDSSYDETKKIVDKFLEDLQEYVG